MATTGRDGRGEDGDGRDLRGLRVFVSYPRGGLAHTWAERIHQHLESQGGDVWRDERSVREGDSDWSNTIRDGLRSSDVVACVVGRDTELCDWQKNELLDARQHGVPVVAFRVDPATPMPWHLNQVQPIELRSDEMDSLRRLAIELARHRRVAPSPHDAAHLHAARQREESYLGNLLHRVLSDVEAIHIPIEGRQRRATTLERSRRTRVFRSDSALRERSMDGDSLREDQVFDDVLDAYRALEGKPVRRLAVLGEPGAGKTHSLERIACDYARRALNDVNAPIPLYVDLGGWTRAGQPLEGYIDWRLETVFKGLRRDFVRLRESGRAVLLLDGLNEMPPGQRMAKIIQVREEAGDSRHASVLVSCRARDFEADCSLPFDEVHLQPLTPEQVREAIVRTMVLDAGEEAGRQQAEVLFQRLAQHLEPDHPRSLLRLASNPYLLTLLMDIYITDGEIPVNRAALFRECLVSLHKRECAARDARHESAPDFEDWRRALVAVAETLQRADGVQGDDGARTSLSVRELPPGFTPDLLAFSIDASVLQRSGDAVRFTHQLLQESLAADVLLDASRSGRRPASDFWPKARWWQRSGWEVVVEIAAEACEGDTAAQVVLIDWLAVDQPGMAVDIWNHTGRPALSVDLLARTAAQWCPRLTDIRTEPAPEARAAIGRWLGALDLDHRPGTGLRPDGMPDIDWVRIDDFEIGRYLVTNRQWQAFIDDGGYGDDCWWAGLAHRMEPQHSSWSEPTAPRETVSWFEAMAYCRWLSAKLGAMVTLPTEAQWERAARGMSGREFAWGNEWGSDLANADDCIGRTSAVGLYPGGATPEGLQDMTGNVWEWCLNEYDNPQNSDPTGLARRVLHGGAWGKPPEYCRVSARNGGVPGVRNDYVGLRLVWRLGAYSEPGFLDHRASDATPSR